MHTVPQRRPAVWLWLITLAWVIYHFSPVGNFDLWWHLDSGRWMLAERRVLLQEIRSALDAGAPWTNFSWGFQVMLALAYRMGGDWGLLAFKLLLWTGLVAIMGRVTVGKDIRRVLPWLLVLAIAGFSLPHYMPLRPHLPAALCLAVSLLLMRQPLHRPVLLSWAAVLLVWANLHASVVVGCAALAFHGIGELRRQDASWRVVFRQGLRLLPFALIPFATPNGFDLLTVLLEHASGDLAKRYILEWASAPLTPPVFFLVGLGAIGFSVFPRRFSYGEFFLFVFFLLLSLQNHRFQFELTLVVLRPATLALSSLIWRSEQGGHRWRTAVAATAAVLLGAGYYGTSPEKLRQRWHAMPVASANYPVTSARLLAAAARQLQRPVKVLNHYEFGGYLAWLGEGNVRPFIDGRTPTIYSDARLMEDLFAISKQRLRRQVADKYGMDAMVLRRDAGLGLPLDDPDWSLVGFDQVSLLYLRTALAKRLGMARIDFEPGVLTGQLTREERQHRVSLLQRMVAVGPENFVAWLQLGVTETQGSGQLTEALAALDRAVALRPAHPLACLLLAQQMVANGQPEDRVYARLSPSLDRAVKELNVRRLQELAELLLQLHRPRSALRVLIPDSRERMYVLDSHYLTWVLRATARLGLGDKRHADFALAMATELVPADDAGGQTSLQAVRKLMAAMGETVD